MSFLDYKGMFDILKDSDYFSFNYYNNDSLESLPFFIVTPIYDIPLRESSFITQMH